MTKRGHGQFQSSIGPADFALIEGVGRIIDPSGWAGDVTIYKFRSLGDGLIEHECTPDGARVIDTTMTTYAREVNARNRARACEIAVEVIAFLRRRKMTA